MTTANSAVATASRPQPSDAQKPQGENPERTSSGACGDANRGLADGRAAIIEDMTATPGMSAVRAGSRRPARDRTASSARRKASVALDRQSDEDQRGEEHQDRDVE